MSLPKSLCDRELDKFADSGANDTCVKVCNPDGTPVTGGGASGAVTPTIYNLSAPTANTEVSQVLSVTVKQLLIRVRGPTGAKAQFSFVATESGTKFITIEKRAVYSGDNLALASATLYIQTDKAAQTIEILEWS